MNTHLKPFFYFENLKTWEKIIIGVYTAVTITLCIWYFLTSIDVKKSILFFYGYGTSVLIYFALYTSLRNLTSYLIWFFFGLVQLTIYFLTIHNQSLIMARGHASSGLKNTIILLVLFQFLRYKSLKLQHREFVVPAKNSSKDLLENKNITATDYFILIIYIGTYVGLVFLSSVR